jgi:YfiH family protein
VHGADVVVVSHPGEHAGASADAAVTAVAGCRLAVRTADCVPVVLVADGAVGVVHAGWRGALAGVVQASVAALRDIGGTGPVRAAIGPCIHTECYEFGADELETVVARYGSGVSGVTAGGDPALDMRAVVRAALREAGVDAIDDDGACTACSAADYYSHRARAEAERFATIAWLEP